MGSATTIRRGNIGSWRHGLGWGRKTEKDLRCICPGRGYRQGGKKKRGSEDNGLKPTGGALHGDWEPKQGRIQPYFGQIAEDQTGMGFSREPGKSDGQGEPSKPPIGGGDRMARG